MATERKTMALNGVPGPVLGDEERSDEAPSTGVNTPRPAPDPEVVAKPKRRQWPGRSGALWRPGEVGQLLRREGSSHLTSA